MRRFALLILVFMASGCSSWSGTPDPASDPLIFFLHGQGGDEYAFTRNVEAEEINRWIENNAVPPFVLIAPRGADVRGTGQWFHRPNEIMLTSDGAGELRAYAREVFRAGVDAGTISVHGHSRGATGALHFALNHPDKFASAVANAFVTSTRFYPACRTRYTRSGITGDPTVGRTASTSSSFTLVPGALCLLLDPAKHLRVE